MAYKIVARTAPSNSGRRRVVRRRKQTWNSEQALISAIINEGNMAKCDAAGVSERWFHSYAAEYGYIVRYVQRRRQPPSKMLFMRKFPDFEIIRQPGDMDDAINDVRGSHARYVMLTNTEWVISALAESNPDDDEAAIKIVGEALAELQAVNLDINGMANHTTLKEGWEEAYLEAAARVERVKKTGLSGIPMGFPTLEKITGGPGPGEYWVVAARLGMGKTWALVRAACTAITAGHTVQYHALEQSRTQIMMRAHSLLSSQVGRTIFKSTNLMQGREVDLIAYKKFLTTLKDTIRGDLIVDDTSRGRLSPVGIGAQMERNHPDLVLIDYLTLLEQNSDDWRGTKNLSADLKGLAMRYETPIVAAAQINRMGIGGALGKEPPGPEHLAGSDAIGQDVDAVVTLKKVSAHVVRMKLAKYRHGEDGIMWWCRFAPNSGKFEEVSANEAQDLMDADKEQDDDE